ncbi:methylenetetrahydrofolate reductase [NAD(P)H] [Hespellia stercorisuis]|uniref:Methylenetetrahydrofolate reductase n=1 Tax=Hespellia stercorisuis DSM 15480 TaxID=1121950 RepID=A0A1M6U3S1_9FIRM|nr:methylenetetrahydrofolate reductase [NAD(P)H] [Hespellia stercorisuis]SHK63813.1 5,10-methylenetetrahydrofolate reductase (NAD(P)) [Hespellia stercorisuis DSM 15480]
MKTVDLFGKKTVLSYEVFPPKATSSINKIYETLDELQMLNPDFISVTYGAGGGGNAHKTFRLASMIKEYGVESVAHLSCISSTKEEIEEALVELKKNGVENILALRGDIPSEGYAPGDFKYASDLIAFIKSHGDFNIIAACYPEGHIEAKSRVEDIQNLKIKVDAGVDQLITQLFFRNEDFYSFSERCQLAGINVPIEAGIMPVTNKKQIERMATLCGVNVPKKFVTMMDRYGDDPIAMRDAGIAYAVNQIVDLIAHGVDGIHLYTMNNPYIARKIYEAIHRLI